MSDIADSVAEGGHDGFTNRVALTIAVLASFAAVSAIKSSNVGQAMEQAQAETNDNWAWYQAVRVREDMASYELAHLQRLARTMPAIPGPPPPVVGAPPLAPIEAERVAADIKAQEAELAHIRARKDEVQKLAQDAQKRHEELGVFDDQYDFSDAMISIAVTLLAVCALAKTRWLYWFGLIPAAGGLFWGLMAMLRWPLHPEVLFAWLN